MPNFGGKQNVLWEIGDVQVANNKNNLGKRLTRKLGMFG